MSETDNGSGALVPAGGDRISDIESMMRDAPDRYYGDEGVQSEYRHLLAARSGDASGGGNVVGIGPPSPLPAAEAARSIASDGPAGASLVRSWESRGGAATHVAAVQRVAGQFVRLGGDTASFDVLPEVVRAAVYAELAEGLPGFAPPATATAMADFTSTVEGREQAEAWGHVAAERLGLFNARVGHIRDSLERSGRAAEFNALLDWFNGLDSRSARAVIVALTT